MKVLSMIGYLWEVKRQITQVAIPETNVLVVDPEGSPVREKHFLYPAHITQPNLI